LDKQNSPGSRTGLPGQGGKDQDIQERTGKTRLFPDRTARIVLQKRLPAQDCQDKTAREKKDRRGQPEPDSQRGAAIIGQAREDCHEKNCKDRTARTGLLGQDCQDNAARITQPGQDRKERIARKGQPDRTAKTEQLAQDSQNETVKT
jgi:hypothetical protein